MTTTRTKAIQALEAIAGDTRVLLDMALSINRLIDQHGLCVRKLDVTTIYGTQEAVDSMLLEMELRAGVTG